MARILGTAWSVHNYGVDSKQLDAMNTDMAITAGYRYNASNSKNKVVLWGGTNDIALTGQTGAQAYTRLQACVATLASEGYSAGSILVLTMLPRGSDAGVEANRQSLNAAIRGGSGYVLVDVAADSRIGDPGKQTDLTYFSADQIHLNNAGYALVAAAVSGVVVV